MYKQLDLFGNVPEEKPVPPAEPGGSAENKPSASAVPAKPAVSPEVKLHVSRPSEAGRSQTAPVAISPNRSSIPAEAWMPPEEITGENPEVRDSPAPTITFVDKSADDPAEDIMLSEPSPSSHTVVITPPKKGKRGRKSQKEMEAEAAAIEIPPDEVLFRKQYYSIGEVSRMFKLNSSLLRYWESEFDIIKPRKNRKGDRHFRPEDIKNLYLIHHLLRARKYTIEGAKTYLKKNKNKASENFEIIQKLEKIKQFLLELKAGL